jgi:antagonist of KipI
MTIHVLRPGIETTVEDLGRPGWAHLGVPRGGAMDPSALAAANLLVGNPPSAAGLEVLGGGLVLQAEGELLVARTGASAPARIGPRPMARGQVYRWRTGEILEIGAFRNGARGYLAVSGGIVVPPFLGSSSTLLRAQVGGFRGRALRRGDRLSVGQPRVSSESTLKPAAWLPALPLRLHLLPGSHFDRFPAAAKDLLGTVAWKVSPQIDRMGLRLAGPTLPVPEGPFRTEGTLPGSVQVFPNGQPVILGPDHPTTGGYPRLAQVARCDLPSLAYLRPGDSVRFAWCTFAEAEGLLKKLLLIEEDAAASRLSGR